MWLIFDFMSRSGSAIQDWLDREKIGRRERGMLENKLDLLAKHGMELPPAILAGPLKSKRKKLKEKNIYKLRVNGDVALRPFLCRGPIDNNGEFTLLLGVIERDGENDHDPCEAEDIRLLVIADPRRRMNHARYR